ncbi:MAG: hypothetical protein JNK53_04275 [Phycisphaerae bacterium]|nr:hypothetical protein [Phycisphaerae bacterium]
MMSLAALTIAVTAAYAGLPPPPPVAELRLADYTLAATTPSGTTLASGNGALDDAMVTLSGGSTGVATLLAWVRDPSVPGAWIGGQPVQAVGMPAFSSTSATTRFVATNGINTLAFRIAPSVVGVLRRAAGAWEYRGSFNSLSLPGSSSTSSAPLVVDGDTLVFGGSKLSVVRRNSEGIWALSDSTPASDLGASSFGWGVLRGDWLLLGSSSLPLRVCVARVEASGKLSPVQTVFAPHPIPWNFGRSIACSGDWVALSCRSKASSALDIAFYRRQPDGTLNLEQYERDTSGVPVHMQDGVLATTRVPWVLVDGVRWRRGAFLSNWTITGATEPMHGNRHGVIGGDVVMVRSGTPAPSLKVWSASMFDCDEDGMPDPAQIWEGAGQDCNLNGQLDSCDLALGLLSDADNDGTPDVCAQDCDGNGTPDLTQIRLGAPTACDDPALLASCAIAMGAQDSNGDGVVDACGPDVNGNGVPDLLEIAAGDALDCDGNGVPDDAPVQQIEANWEPAGTWYYPYGAVLVAAVFPTEEEHRWLTGVGLRIRRWQGEPNGFAQCSPVNQPINAAIALDPNADGIPSDAVVVATASGIASDTDWQVLRFEPVEITTGAYFVVFTLRAQPGVQCIDLDFNPDDCTQLNCGRAFSGSFQSTDSPLDIEARLRVATPNSSGLTAPFAVFSAICPEPCDFDGNGAVNGADLGALLAAWGPAQGSVCDVNYDNSVDGADLGVLLSRWGPVRTR